MSVSVLQIEAVLKEQIVKSRQPLADMGYDEAFVRARIAHLAYHKGGPALDIGTGSCACMAATLARRGLRVTAVDHSHSAIQFAKKRAVGNRFDSFEVLHAEAAHLPFANGAYHIAVAFDILCHASDPASVLGEMFRVSNGLVMISELNSTGCQVTHHPDKGFDTKLSDLLSGYCQSCQRFEDTHHVTYVCEAL